MTGGKRIEHGFYGVARRAEGVNRRAVVRGGGDWLSASELVGGEGENEERERFLDGGAGRGERLRERGKRKTPELFGAEGEGEGAELAEHHTGGDAGVAEHEGAGGGFVVGREDDQAHGFVAGFGGAAGEDDLAGVGGGFEALEVRADGGFVGLGPSGVVVETRGEAEDDEELFFRGGFGGGGCGGGGRIGRVGTRDEEEGERSEREQREAGAAEGHGEREIGRAHV